MDKTLIELNSQEVIAGTNFMPVSVDGVELKRTSVNQFFQFHEGKNDPHPQYLGEAAFESSLTALTKLLVGPVVTLSDEESRRDVIIFTGDLTENCRVEITQSSQKIIFFVDNTTSSNGSTVSVATIGQIADPVQLLRGKATTAYSDGVNVYNNIKQQSVVNDTTSNSLVYPVLSQLQEDLSSVRISSSKLSFNPSTGVLSSIFSGNGSNLTGLNASNITLGTLSNDRTSAASVNGANTIVLRDASGNFSAGTITATFSGNGASLTNLNANNIATGTLANARTTANSSNVANTIVLRDAGGNFSAGTITATLSGNATTATTLQNIRTITLTGDVVGSFSFNGSSNVSFATTIAPNSVALGADTTGNYAGSVAVSGSGLSISGSPGEGTAYTINSNATNVNAGNTIVLRDAGGNFSAGTITATLSGNSTTSTALQTPRLINGTSFNGTANITTASWGSARTISLSGAVNGSAVVDGSANVNIVTTSNVTSSAIPQFQLFTANGTTSNFTVPAGVTRIRVTCVGGGGGGGSGFDNGAANGPRGGPGGVAVQILTVTPGTVYSVTVGSGGAGNNTGPQNGSAGTASSFGTLVTAGGGGGGVHNGSPGATGTNSGTIYPYGIPITGATPIAQDIINGASFVCGFGVPIRENAANATAPLRYFTTGRYYAGAPGSGEIGNTGNASGGVGGAVLIEW